MDKKALRAEIREKKRALTERQILCASSRLAELLYRHPLYQNAKSLYAYLSYNQEVRTLPILARAQRDGKRVAVPKVFGEEMRFLWLDDLARCAETVERCCGVRARLFRPPGGLTSPALLDAAKSRGLPVILWSVDPMDWDRAHHAGVYETVVQDASPGAVILMHDLFENSVSCALRAIDTLQAQGYRFVTVPELAARAGSALTPGTVYRSFS